MHALTADQISLVPKVDLSRRLFAVTSLAAGFASAVMPVGAATITTDAEGLPDTEVGTFPQGLMDEAKRRGWVVIRMKSDWKTVLPPAK